MTTNSDLLDCLMIHSPSLQKCWYRIGTGDTGPLKSDRNKSSCSCGRRDRQLFLWASDWRLHLIMAIIIQKAADVVSHRCFRFLLTRQESLGAAIKAASTSCDLPPFVLVSSRCLPATAFSFRYPPPPLPTSTCSCFFSLVNTYGTCRRFIFKTGSRGVITSQLNKRCDVPHEKPDCCEISKAHCEPVVVLIWAAFFSLFTPWNCFKGQAHWI